MRVLDIFCSFLKIGVIGFGGGSALVPIVEREMIVKQKAITDTQFLKHTVVASITPGALPVKLGASCGYQLGGSLGALAGSVGALIPGVTLTIILMSLFSTLSGKLVDYFNYASIGITVFVVFLLFSYIHRTMQHGQLKVNLLICAVSFTLTGERALCKMLGMLTASEIISSRVPLFGLSMVDLFMMTFFIILLLGKTRRKYELLAVFFICIAYAFCVGVTGTALHLEIVGKIIAFAMAVLLIIIYGFRRDRSARKTTFKMSKRTIRALLLFLFLPLICVLVSIPLLKNVGTQYIWNLLSNIGISTITSFGGGEAYISVADGIFVQGGFITPEMYYTKVVPIANALPGPILIKVAAGISFILGVNSGGIALGVALAATATAITLSICGALAITVFSVYDCLGASVFINNLKAYVLPVICGMLITTTCSMLYESMKIAHENGIAALASLPAMLLAVHGIYLLHKKTRLPEVLLLVLSSGISVAVVHLCKLISW